MITAPTRTIVRRPLALSILPRGRGWRLLAAAALLAGALAMPADAGAQGRTARPLAIVVHVGVPVNGLSFAELRRIFLGEQQYWPDRSKVTILVRAPTAYERSLVLDRIYKMDEDRFRQYWIGKMFRAEVAAGPKIVYSSEMAINLVSAIRGSITFVPLSAVTPDVKVLRIDGKLPSEPGYPLK